MQEKINEAYDAYSEKWIKNRKKDPIHELFEKPAMYAELPDLRGKNVLCIGSGSGEKCNYIKKQGAFLFSVNHPLKIAAKKSFKNKTKKLLIGTIEDFEKNKLTILGDYFKKESEEVWSKGKFKSPVYNKTFSKRINTSVAS